MKLRSLSVEMEGWHWGNDVNVSMNFADVIARVDVFLSVADDIPWSNHRNFRKRIQKYKIFEKATSEMIEGKMDSITKTKWFYHSTQLNKTIPTSFNQLIINDQLLIRFDTGNSCVGDFVDVIERWSKMLIPLPMKIRLYL